MELNISTFHPFIESTKQLDSVWKKQNSAQLLSQTFNLGWHQELVCKIKTTTSMGISHNLVLLWQFCNCHAGVRKRSVLADSVQHVHMRLTSIPWCYFCNISRGYYLSVVQFRSLYCKCTTTEATDTTSAWLKKYRIKASATKSQHFTFVLRKGGNPHET